MTTETGELLPENEHRLSSASEGFGARIANRLPRPETTLLMLAFVWTIVAKFVVILGQAPGRIALDLAAARLPDVAFFAAAALLFSMLYLTGWRRLAARLTLAMAAVALGWSVLNAAWLISAGAQLQPGVAWILFHDAAAFWPIVEGRLSSELPYAIAIFATLVAAVVWFVWRLVQPRAVRGDRRHTIYRAIAAAAVLVVATFGTHFAHRGGMTAYSSQIIGFSSHWYALHHVLREAAYGHDVAASSRDLPRAGQLSITTPSNENEDKPNVVLVLLESVSYQASSLGDPSSASTPTLEKLAREGVEFTSTRVPIPMTDKAFWATLTGRTPDVQDDHVESVITDAPYESLASILGKEGYRSAFFEVSKGSFKCAPGLFANLAFDWAWFRENLEDPSAHIGSLNGDDFRMIDPMFEWVDQNDQPFLLVMITTVAHFPYELPRWYDHEPKEDRYEKYLQTVEFSDAFLAEVDAQLAKRGLTDNTILCVIGDHGESFRPESRQGRWAPFEEIIRVPWVMRWPGHVKSGRTIDWPCSQLDVTPTILKLLGYRFDEADFDGKDAFEPIPSDRRFYFMTWFRQSPIGFLEGSRKLVYWPYTDTLFEYDLTTDPGEKSPRILDRPQRDPIIRDILRWRDASRMEVPVHRFRKRLVYDHWQTFSSGRSAWAYYVP